jgi:peptide/nickel transport system permease protein
MGGGLLIESYFGVPGVGAIVHEAIIFGDLPIMKAVLLINMMLYLSVQISLDYLCSLIDPR